MKKVAVYTGSRNLYPHMVTAAKSLVANSTVDEVWFFIEDDEFPMRLPKIVKTMNVSPMLSRFREDGPNWKTQFTPVVLMRACYCSLFPDEDVVLQLDVDTVCVDNIDGIWDTDLTGKWAAMVQESQKWYRPYGGDMDPEHKYWNAGVCLQNLKRMREENAEQKMVDYLNHHFVRYVDQDAMNCLGHFAIADMPLRYNEAICNGYTAEPAIVHYAGSKTWMNEDCMDAARLEYLKKYRDMSWKGAMRLHENLTRRTDV